MCQVFHMVPRYVTCVVYRCWKSRSRCCICCNCCIRMFQVYVPNISSILDECCNCVCLHVAKVDLDVAYVAIAVYVCFKCMFQIFHLF
jgi:hypothetical protein